MFTLHNPASYANLLRRLLQYSKSQYRQDSRCEKLLEFDLKLIFSEFVARQLDLMRPVIESLIPINKSESENQFSELELNLEEFYSKVKNIIENGLKG